MRKQFALDDSKMIDFCDMLSDCIDGMVVSSVVRRDYGSMRVMEPLVRKYIQKYMDMATETYFGKGYANAFYIDVDHATHAHDIGNNNEYPVIFHKKDSKTGELIEDQILGYLNLNTGLYGELYLSLDDLNHNVVLLYKLNSRYISKEKDESAELVRPGSEVDAEGFDNSQLYCEIDDSSEIPDAYLDGPYGKYVGVHFDLDKVDEHIILAAKQCKGQLIDIEEYKQIVENIASQYSYGGSKYSHAVDDIEAHCSFDSTNLDSWDNEDNENEDESPIDNITVRHHIHR